jgi:hypothetical protein
MSRRNFAKMGGKNVVSKYKRRIFKIAETSLMLVALWWGVLLIIPARTFSNPVYHAMESLMPESVWGIQCLFIGIVLLCGMVVRNKLLRNIGLLLSTGFWIFVSVSLWLGDHYTTGTSYAIWAIMAAWLYIHLIKVGDG